MNKVILFGYVGKDPEQIKGGYKFSLATNESKKNSNGEYEKVTLWHNIVVFGNTAETVEKFVKKGMKVLAYGKISQNNFKTDSGENRIYTSIVCNQVFFDNRKAESENTVNYNRSNVTSVNKTISKNEFEDDIPF